MLPFGLDISELSLKLVQFKPAFSLRKPQINLYAYNEIAVPEGYLKNGEIKNPEGVIELINTLMKTAKIHRVTTKEVISVLPEPKTFIKLLEIDQQKNQIAKTIEAELKYHLPFSPEEIYFDWQIIEGNKKILVGVAPKNIIDQYTQVLEKAHLIPLALEIEAAPLVRSLITEKESQKTMAIVDFGATRSSFIMYNQGTILYTISIPISGQAITKKIAETLKLTLPQAEKAKKVCGLDPKKCKGALGEVLYESIENLVKKIRESITYYENHFTSPEKISKLILCGGGANFKNLDSVLTKKLNLDIQKGDPTTNIETKKIPPTAIKSPTYATAIGLALRNLR